jgi:hypothetical protein
MNFISEMEGQEIHVELKYCERCGGLWLRPQGAGGVYCAPCGARLAAMPDPGEPSPGKARRRKARMPRAKIQQDDRDGDLQGPARIDYLQGVAAMEVRA